MATVTSNHHHKRKQKMSKHIRKATTRKATNLLNRKLAALGLYPMATYGRAIIVLDPNGQTPRDATKLTALAALKNDSQVSVVCICSGEEIEGYRVDVVAA